MKNLSHLRELNNPKVGDIVTVVTAIEAYKIEAIIGDQVCISTTSSGGEVKAYLTSGYCLRQIPLLWLEDTPIYEGDVLYVKESGQSGKIILSCDARSFCVLDIVESINKTTNTAYFHNELTLTKPKVKMTKWVNIYENSDLAAVHDTKNQAEFYTMPSRVACVEVSWEE